jgi:hypothetical protein
VGFQYYHYHFGIVSLKKPGKSLTQRVVIGDVISRVRAFLPDLPQGRDQQETAILAVIGIALGGLIVSICMKRRTGNARRVAAAWRTELAGRRVVRRGADACAALLPACWCHRG